MHLQVTPQHGISYKSKDSATLSCDVQGLSASPLTWHYGGSQIDTTVTEGKYEIHAENNSLTINNIDQVDVGTYICKTSSGGNDFEAEVELLASPRIMNNDVQSKNLVEGDPLVLECKAWGNPNVSVTWSREGLNLNISDRVEITNYTHDENGFVAFGGKLRIDNMGFDDGANYECTALNSAGNSTHVILIRVKNKLAALWPFLGICAEVAILCTIIFIYERKRAKKLEEEERKEEADHLTNSNDHKDLRQRKPEK